MQEKEGIESLAIGRLSLLSPPLFDLGRRIYFYLFAQDQVFGWAKPFNHSMIAVVLPAVISVLLFVLVRRVQKGSS